jgi:hypothetical protein
LNLAKSLFSALLSATASAVTGPRFETEGLPLPSAAPEAAGFEAVPTFNSYWNQSDRTFEDCNGYRVVIQLSEWRG